ncbi:hypothetical protein M1494_00530 [Candidatus Parvarchaeota archaeon]|nr:hypothetical protein [Candidatus Parvarchaeota archaeon]
MKAKIIGILASKNLVSQGYPFLEAIYSFLNWGDELYISDGYSNDGTYEILERLSKNKRIHIYRYRWPELKKGASIGAAYNNLIETAKKRVGKQDYIFELQANEIAHEESYNKLRNLIKEYQQTKVFVLPYNLFCWRYILNYDWRFRLIKANSYFKSLGDGMHLEPLNEVSVHTVIRDVIGQVYRYKKHGQYYSRLFNLTVNRGKRKEPALYQVVPLYPPIFRYNLLFPENIIKKLKGHSELYKTKEYDRKDMFYDADNFLKSNYKKLNVEALYYNFIKRYFNSIFININNKSYLDIIKRTELENIKHPKIMKDIINLYKYEPREEIINQIIKI